MKQYVIDAFTDTLFGGNPAAVCILSSWPEDALLIRIAMENNLSETAYAVPEADGYRLRWFTPAGEIDLCGHATLATAFAITRFVEPDAAEVRFHTLSGLLRVVRSGDLLEMDFPAYVLKPVPVTDEMALALGVRPLEAFMARDLLCVLGSEEEVRNLAPDMEHLKRLDGALTHVTAAGRDYDCVSRSFAPKEGIPEDPVCGSGHCHILPYWAERLGKPRLIAWQASRRGGLLHGEVLGKRVKLSGSAVLFSIAELQIDA